MNTNVQELNEGIKMIVDSSNRMLQGDPSTDLNLLDLAILSAHLYNLSEAIDTLKQVIAKKQYG